MPEIDTPQFSMPFRIDEATGEPALVEQDTLDEVTDCVEALARTPLGFYEEEPDYGVDDQTFREGGVDIVELQGAISQWEERADTAIEEDPDAWDHFITHIKIYVRGTSDA